MSKRKENRQYIFSVEGETEKWYLEWLAREINSQEGSKYNVIIKATVEKNPSKFVKRVTLPVVSKAKLTHLCDVEGETPSELCAFERVLSLLEQAKKARKVNYLLGYSHFSFELWMILHKINFHSPLSTKKQYLIYINRCFETNFESLDQYKEENNFEKCLSSLTIQDVKQAVKHAKALMAEKKENGSHERNFKSYTYYPDNPALTIWESIAQILLDCGLMQKQDIL